MRRHPLDKGQNEIKDCRDPDVIGGGLIGLTPDDVGLGLSDRWSALFTSSSGYWCPDDAKDGRGRRKTCLKPWKPGRVVGEVS